MRRKKKGDANRRQIITSNWTARNPAESYSTDEQEQQVANRQKKEAEKENCHIQKSLHEQRVGTKRHKEKFDVYRE